MNQEEFDMIKVMFVCHGNICRSPMAEFLLKDMVQKRGIGEQFIINSSATSTEEIGNVVHRGTRQKLHQLGITCDGKTAIQLVKSDYNKYDYIIAMDSQNLQNIKRIVGQDTKGKISLLLDYTDSPGNIADPWFTGDFEATYQDVLRGIQGLLSKVGFS